MPFVCVPSISSLLSLFSGIVHPRFFCAALSIFRKLAWYFGKAFPQVLLPAGFCPLGFVNQFFQRHDFQLASCLEPSVSVRNLSCCCGWSCFPLEPHTSARSPSSCGAWMCSSSACSLSCCILDHLLPLFDFRHPSKTLQGYGLSVPTSSLPIGPSCPDFELDFFSNHRCDRSTFATLCVSKKPVTGTCKKLWRHPGIAHTQDSQVSEQVQCLCHVLAFSMFFPKFSLLTPILCSRFLCSLFMSSHSRSLLHLSMLSLSASSRKCLHVFFNSSSGFVQFAEYVRSLLPALQHL